MEDGVARAFLWALLLLGTHWLIGCLNGSMRATSVTCGHDGDLLDAILASASARGDTSSGRAVSRLGNCRGAQANLWRTADNCTGCYESIWGGLISRRIDILLLDDRSLIAGSYVSLLAADSATRVRAHVFDLSNVVVLLNIITITSLHIVEEDASLILFTLSGFSHERRLRNKGLIGRREVLILHQLAHAAVARVCYLLLDASTTASLPANWNNFIWLRSQSHFMNFIDLISRSGRLRSGTL